MCGIAGLLRTRGSAPVDRLELEALTTALAHRGPDGYGIHVDGPVGLGHRRLSIIDLDTGDQPQQNEDGSVWVVFNGEIYNYRTLARDLAAAGHVFRTQSDTEVIVHAYEQWGRECPSRLRGMFAFAVWDAKSRQLFLARDRVGIKPLCYVQGPRQFAFASELQAFSKLRDFDPSLDLEALDLYLHLQYIPAPLTIYREVRKLPPGHFMVVHEAGRLEGPSPYWDMTFEPDSSLSEANWVERLDAALADAVESHLVSDVPFGAFLSGGIDSSTVVAYMSRTVGSPVQTFTIAFDDPGTDEREYAAQAAAILGTDHHVEVVQPDALELLPTLVDHYGEPFADSSAIPTYLVSRMARRRVKMVLSGDGGDEVFAGYSYFPKMMRAHPTPSGALGRTRRRLANVARWAGLVAPLPALADSWYQRSPFFREDFRALLWRPDHRWLLQRSRSWNEAQFAAAGPGDPLSRCQHVDIHNYLPSDNLNKVDIASMAHGLEVRVPLLDHLLLETVAKLPVNMRIRLSGVDDSGGESSPTTKYLLRRVGGRFFPPGFFDRRKMGFSVPLGRWLGAINPDDVRERLLDGPPLLRDLFCTDRLEALITGRAEASGSHRLWAMMFLGEWLRRFPVTLR
jgi:asparagine synthase (glutamine-hydrolysing)